MLTFNENVESFRLTAHTIVLEKNPFNLTMNSLPERRESSWNGMVDEGARNQTLHYQLVQGRKKTKIFKVLY